jgi:hypothetical protein
LIFLGVAEQRDLSSLLIVLRILRRASIECH